MNFLTSVCVALALTGMGPQLDADGDNVAVVNLTRVFERYQMTRDLEQMFADQRQALTADAEKMRDAIGLQRNALEQFKPGSPDYQEREESLVREEINFQVWLDVQERRLKRNHKQWLLRIYEDVERSVTQMAEQRGIALVLTYSDLDTEAPDSVALKQQILLRTVIYAHPRIDLTEPVLHTLDALYQRKGGSAMLNAPPISPAQARPVESDPQN